MTIQHFFDDETSTLTYVVHRDGGRKRLYAFPDATRLLVCHDYRPGGRPLRFETTIAEQKAQNVHVRADTTCADVVALRTPHDASLDTPVLILSSVQVNIRAGALPEPESNGTRYLKIPLDRF